MKQTMFSRGFTLIELLVVIAIIGILAAVVIGSLNDARSGGQDASAKQTLSNIRTQAEIVYSGNNFSYATVCTDPRVVPLLSALIAVTPATGTSSAPATASSPTNIACQSRAADWAVSAPIATRNGTTQQYFCVDSRGTSGVRTGLLAGSTFQCPAI